MINLALSLMFFTNIDTNIDTNIANEIVSQASPTSPQTATIQEIIDGRQIFIEQQPARLRDRARQGQTIRTATARAEIEFNNGAIARMGNNSRLLVGSCVNLGQGNLLVSGNMPACTRTITAAVRGTTYYLEIDTDDDDDDDDETLTETISVIEGELTVSDPTQPERPPIRLRAGQRLRAIGGKLRERLENMTQAEFEQIIQAKILRGYRRRLANRARIARVLEQKFPRSRLIPRLR